MGLNLEQVSYYCPFCKDAKGFNDIYYYKKDIIAPGIIDKGNRSYEAMQVGPFELKVIHVICRHCKTILSTIGSPESLKKIKE